MYLDIVQQVFANLQHISNTHKARLDYVGILKAGQYHEL